MGIPNQLVAQRNAALNAIVSDAYESLFPGGMTAEQAAAHRQGERMADELAVALRSKAPPDGLLLCMFAKCNGDTAMQWGLLNRFQRLAGAAMKGNNRGR